MDWPPWWRTWVCRLAAWPVRRSRPTRRPSTAPLPGAARPGAAGRWTGRRGGAPGSAAWPRGRFVVLGLLAAVLRAAPSAERHFAGAGQRLRGWHRSGRPPAVRAPVRRIHQRAGPARPVAGARAGHAERAAATTARDHAGRAPESGQPAGALSGRGAVTDLPAPAVTRHGDHGARLRRRPADCAPGARTPAAAVPR